MRRLPAIGLLALSLCLSSALAVTPASQQQAAGSLVKQLKAAGSDPLKLTQATEAIGNNPAAIEAVMASGDQRLIRTYLEQASLLNSRSALAHQDAIAEAEGLIGAYREAARAGNPAAQREAALKLIENPQAVRRLNLSGDDALIRSASDQMSQLQDETRNLLRGRIAERLGIPPEEVVFADITHASAKPKLGQDWDLTVRRVRQAVDPKTGQMVQVVEDIRPQQIAEVVDTAFFEAATGRAPASLAEAQAFSHAKNLELTWALHKEAMGGSIAEGQAIVGGQLAVRDAQQMALVSEFKIQKPVAEHVTEITEQAAARIKALNLPADHPEVQQILTDAAAEAHKYHLERARTHLKMFEKHIAPRVAHYGGKVPERIVEANKVLQALADDTISASEAARRLGELGTSIDDVVAKSSGLIEAAKVLAPAQKPPPSLFQEQWQIVRDSKLVGGAFKLMGQALSGASTGGEFSKHLLEEMDRAVSADDDPDLVYALARTWDTSVTEPIALLGALAGKGIEKGAIKIGQGMEGIADFLSGRAAEVGWVQAFGEGAGRTMAAAMTGALAAGDWALDKAGEGAVAAWEGAKYAVANPLAVAGAAAGQLQRANLKAGEFLGLQAMGELVFREHETLIANDIELRRQLRATADALAARADRLQEIIAKFKAAVRDQDPEGTDFQRTMSGYIERYDRDYRSLAEDYVGWRVYLNRGYGGIEHPTIAATWRDLREPLAKVNALPARLTDTLDAAFLKGLLSTVRVQLVDAANGKPVSAGGSLQFNGEGLDKVCRGQGPILECAGLPPGEFQMRVKVGDYVEQQRTLRIQPLARRRYEQRMALGAEVPSWARLTVNVRDVQTQSPVPGAHIRFQSSAEKPRETTSSTGSVQVNQILAGEVVVSASAPGYLANQSRLRIDPAKQTEYGLDLYLQPDGSAQVKAKPAPEPAPELPAPESARAAPSTPAKAAEQEDAARRRQVEACLADKQEIIDRAMAANAKIDGGTVVLYANEGCQKSHKSCEDKAQADSNNCRAKAPSASAVAACGDAWTVAMEQCAAQEVQCSAGSLKQRCQTNP